MELDPHMMGPWRTAVELTNALQVDLDQAAGPIQFNMKCHYWRDMIQIHQGQALVNLERVAMSYTPGSPLYVCYSMSHKYAMRLYSRCRTQFTFWAEGGHGSIPPEAECHRN